VAAKILAAEIKKSAWYESVPKKKFRQQWLTKPNKGPFYQEYEKAFGTELEPEALRMRRITIDTKKGKGGFGLRFPESPVIVIGDSNVTRWSRWRASLEYFEGKRVVIWCLSARAFTNTREGWIPMPL
jgi:hypothetical protein